MGSQRLEISGHYDWELDTQGIETETNWTAVGLKKKGGQKAKFYSPEKKEEPFKTTASISRK